MKSLSRLYYLVIPSIFVFFCCEKPEEIEKVDYLDVQFSVPEYLEIQMDGDRTISFDIIGGMAPETTDVIVLESEDGKSYSCRILTVSEDSLTIELPDDIVTGAYTVFVKRDSRRKQIGNAGGLYINFVEGTDLDLDKGTTVYGFVKCGDEGVPGVVVSDGIDVTVTDEDGMYQLASEKKWGYVFISVPSGYEVPSDGILPKFHNYLKAGVNVQERADFSISAVPSQNKFKILVMGDMHLARRNGDLSQFSEFTAEVNEYVNSRKDENIYAVTLGDMTWDLYWYDNNYYFPDYLETMNSSVKNLQIFHTMGNHDNDYKTYTDFDAAFKYVRDIAPSYYSFNIGKVHFVVLDDIDCDNYNGTTSRNYVKNVSDEQMEWLRKDLSYVDKSTPVIVTAHAQIFYPVNSSARFKIDHDASNTNELFSVLDGYEVHFITAHTHMCFNVVPEDNIVGGRNFYEHNSGSVCATWWWSGSLTPGIHVSTDGTPGGYAIWDINGTDMEWIYKSTGFSEDYQFRSYDLNNVAFSYDDVPNLTNEEQKQVFKKYIDAYPGQKDNMVLINIWNWNPGWSLEVKDETGAVLDYEEVWAYDPLHIAALTVKRFNKNISSTPNFITLNFPHFFKVRAGNSDVDLTITVRDEFGHTWIENMERPKTFSIDEYKK